MGRDNLNIMIGGEAGQGLVTVGDLLVRILVRQGFHVVVTQDYLSRIRGGHNTFTVRANVNPIAASQEVVDVLVALDEETVRRHRGEMAADGLVLAGAAMDIPDDGIIMKVPYKDIAAGRFSNTAALGAVAAVLGLDRDTVLQSLEKAFGKKHPEAVEANREAVDNAYQWYEHQKQATQGLNPPRSDAKRLTMNGNEAIALGAMAAGVNFCSFYPMTPATSIALNLAARAEKLGLVVEQAEDEISAINMALGASYAGAVSITSTSGGGFALMTEGISLAGAMETPIVVAIAQRPGPATGLPTRTEQGDLEMVLYAGHGEFARAIYAPGSVEECFHLTRQAFRIAQDFQTPVFVLTDQFLADSYRAVEPFDLEAGPVVNPAADQPKAFSGPYLRFALTENGVSPRLLPGLSEQLVVSCGDEHTEDGHLTEDLSVRKLMVEKRLKKLGGLKKSATPPSYFGDDDPEVLLVCWGTTLGSAREAADMFNAKGQKTAVLHFSQVWPLVPDRFMSRLKKAGQAVMVEGNATGQMANLIRRETGFEFAKSIRRYDGLPITPEYILREWTA